MLQLHRLLCIVLFVTLCSCSNMMAGFGDGNGGGADRSLKGGFTINSNTSFAYEVPLTLSIAVSNATEMRFMNDGGSWSSWMPYTSSLAWDIDISTAEKKVLGQFRDASGNILDASDSIVYVDKIKGSAAAKHNHFGWSMAVSSDGNTVIAGSDSSDYSFSGYAAIYEWDSLNKRWNGTELFPFNDSLTQVSTQAFDMFGYSVAISGDGKRAVVSAYNLKYIYIYEKNTSGVWENIKRITGSDSGFGMSVAISGNGNRIAAGAPGRNDQFSNQGGVYIYEKDNGGANNWGSLIVLSSSSTDGLDGDRLGAHAAISYDGSRVIASTLFNGANNGRVFIFATNGTYTILSNHLGPVNPSEEFGGSIALSGDGNVIAVGIPGDDTNEMGSVYIYRWNAGFHFTQKLVEFEIPRGEGDLFGSSVALNYDGSRIVAGSPKAAISGIAGQGAAYIFSWNGTSYDHLRKLSAPDGVSYAWFGLSTGITSDGVSAFAGCRGDDIYSADDNKGSVYVFRSY